ncbi:ribosome-binding factor A family protein [Candidatus Neoehrlichia lotoris str. RAC413]|uniref:Ribosome-binding factor A n=1 Tax=Candidatus Neoehrlichia procyonis str. RAC413 TaxID=1359163 RepID=A0A0F3NPR8_9RICK|nr:ribosome-binding factor A [Candidatus Neoehrlichia lotoris]KJV68914.1 ribosome-binding factor A family protein [Candidatus Neoehrlichia lotoris str. RAC413]
MYQPISYRNLKVASVLSKAIMQLFIKEYSDLGRILSVSKVIVSENTRDATVLVVISDSYYGDIDVIKALNAASHIIRKSIFNYVKLRYVPRLYFKLDYKFDHFTKINQMFIGENFNTSDLSL